ncbi:MAG: AmmeMemoRadiSam system protein A [Deltaproteobacteria bacterium]|nr:AmmeMemoRadiSam system protein A [Deltaproteobacteria bacterium]MBW2418400.1 AmmeMemoRadiSam system protein A [Deltaproteobacteria bacterium]
MPRRESETARPSVFPDGWEERHEALLLELARSAIRHGTRTGNAPSVDLDGLPVPLREPRACFVTLRKRGELRGCIGSLEARQALAYDTSDNAFKAAFRDPRFAAVEAAELPELEIHISVLSPLERVHVDSEGELLALLQPGIDGVLLVQPPCRGTFLPSVWEGLPEPEQFLRELKRKAGLPEEHWSEDLEVWRYTTQSMDGRWQSVE